MENAKETKEIMKDYTNAVFGFLIGLSAIVLAISNMSALDAMILFIGFFVIATDDWLLSIRFLKKFPPRSRSSFLLNTYYPMPFVFMIFSLAMIANNPMWLGGYIIGFALHLIIDAGIYKISMHEYRKKHILAKYAITELAFLAPTILLFVTFVVGYVPQLIVEIGVPVLYILHRMFSSEF
jgi:cobalamin synthase